MKIWEQVLVNMADIFAARSDELRMTRARQAADDIRHLLNEELTVTDVASLLCMESTRPVVKWETVPTTVAGMRSWLVAHCGGLPTVGLADPFPRYLADLAILANMGTMRDRSAFIHDHFPEIRQYALYDVWHLSEPKTYVYFPGVKLASVRSIFLPTADGRTETETNKGRLKRWPYCALKAAAKRQ